MTSPVRPPILPPTSPSAAHGPSDPARLAAQRAFFDLALGKPAATPTAAPAPSPTAQASAAPATVAAPSTATPDTPQKILRPGSLLDIRV